MKQLYRRGGVIIFALLMTAFFAVGCSSDDENDTPTKQKYSVAIASGITNGYVSANPTSAEAYSASLSDEQKAAAIAVIFFVEGTKKLGVGLAQWTSIAWAADETTGYNTNITELQAKYSKSDRMYIENGTNDGSTSLTTINSFSDYNATNYPAWAWIESYATTTGLTETYASGW